MFQEILPFQLIELVDLGFLAFSFSTYLRHLAAMCNGWNCSTFGFWDSNIFKELLIVERRIKCFIISSNNSIILTLMNNSQS